MTNLNIKLPGILDFDAVQAVIEDLCANETLHLTMKGTLKKHPGCIHWHFKKGEERGILEVTWWPSSAESKPSRLWLSVHGNRKADWIFQTMPLLKNLIEARLANIVDR